jgi:UDP-N-acetylmuramoyl-tripeptide--D-alanyl-D-alanine ligase
MKLWNNIQIAEALKQEVNFKFEADSVTTDTRKIKGGEIFICLKGNNFDGNDYAEEALKKGAVAVITDDEKNKILKKAIFVDNGLDALTKLARHRRKTSKAQFIAITGSVGKTTTKELVRDILSQQFKVHATIGNLNNHIGVPLTVANMPLDTQKAVIEMGMNNAGEMSYLSSIARPDIAAITWVAENHLENLGSLENIAKAKAEIYEWVRRSGAVFAPSDNHYYYILVEAAENNGITDIYAFGTDINYLNLEGEKYSAQIFDDEVSFSKKVANEISVNNILAALSISKLAGADIIKGIKVIENFKLVKGRGLRGIEPYSGATIIDDSYNASPTSMVKALNNFKGESGFKRKIAVLGDMLELGGMTEEYHKSLATHIENIDECLSVGNHMKALYTELLGKKGVKNKYFENIDQAYEYLKANLQKDDLVLIKGSHGSNLYKLVEKLNLK